MNTHEQVTDLINQNAELIKTINDLEGQRTTGQMQREKEMLQIYGRITVNSLVSPWNTQCEKEAHYQEINSRFQFAKKIRSWKIEE